MSKFIRILALVLVLTLLTGCSAVGEIAENVKNAAMEELKNQLQSTLEKNKVEVLQVKSTAGKLNDEGGKLQFFVAFLVRSQNTQQLDVASEALTKIGQTGWTAQTGAAVVSPHLVHKQLEFDADKVTENCYLLYLYIPEFTLDLQNVTLPPMTLPN